MKYLAARCHENQCRKGDIPLPYIVHPQTVVTALLEWGENLHSDAVAMGWGHDLLEDTTVSESEIIAASSENVLEGIRLLTCPDGMTKSRYMQRLVDEGGRDVLLVKLADRICNTRDFILLEGRLQAFRYMKKAECLIPALEKFKKDPVVKNGLKAWKNLEALLQNAPLEAVRGCLLGGGAGDALGSPVEFMSEYAIRRKYGDEGVTDYVEFGDGTGAVTDDTQMTLFTAEGLLRAAVRAEEKGVCAPEEVMRYAYLRWLKTQNITVNCHPDILDSGWLIKEKKLFRRRAPGNTCLSALEYSTSCRKAPNDSKGCGTVMRMAPAGLFLEPEAAYEQGCAFSALTHGHPTGYTAGGAFAMLIAFLYQGYDLEDALDRVTAHLEDIGEARETLEALRKARKAEKVSELGEGWVAEEALAIAVFCSLKHPKDFRKGVLAAVNITGDSDSTGALTGNILGLLNGENAIPLNWRKNLREYAVISKMADDLYTRCEENADGEVTESWWEKYPGF